MGIEKKYLVCMLYVCLAVTVLAGVLVNFHEHAHAAFLWQAIPGFSAICGFIGCILIIVVSKALGHHWLQRGEDYYD